jgi:hypothetical protein
MKRAVALVLVCIAAGCAYQGKTIGEYLEDPKTIIQDPHYMEYRSKRDQIEADYLNKKITYSDYLNAIKELDQNYTKEVYERNEIITNR